MKNFIDLQNELETLPRKWTKRHCEVPIGQVEILILMTFDTPHPPVPKRMNPPHSKKGDEDCLRSGGGTCDSTKVMDKSTL